MNMATNGRKTRTEQIAELTVRKFFDHYLDEVFPQQLTAAITAHNKDVTAHEKQIKTKIQTEVQRLKIWIFGLIFAGGIGSGFALGKLLATL